MKSRIFLAFSLFGLLAGLLLVGCEVSGSGISVTTLDDLERPALAVYQNTSSNPYRDVLLSCVEDPCSLRQLPFIGTITTTPTVDDLMNRVVVSHEWMGMRFRQAIETLDAPARHALLQLSRSIIAVIISADVRPSYYTALTSMTFLDPLRLALTEEEEAVIDTAPDYRSGFGNVFQFVGSWRYVTNDYQYLYALSSAERQLQDARRYLARLLFHELAHANDYYSHGVIADITCGYAGDRCDSTPWQNFVNWAGERRLSLQFGIVSADDAQDNDYHLHDHNMTAYAAVRYGGRTATSEQRAVRAAEIGGWFAADEANHDYGYTNSREDVAMLVEGVLVKHLFDADMDVGYINRPDDGEVSGETTPVDWGVRGRIGDEAVKRRAKKLLDLMLPGLVPESFYAELEPARAMDSGCGWIDNLDLSCAPPINGLLTEGELPQEHAPHDFWLDALGPHER